MKKKVQEKNLDVEVYSAGIYAEDGDDSTCSAIETMKNMGIDMKNHRATNIRNSKIDEMDLILCATNMHKMQTVLLYPNLKNKIYTIKEYAEGNNEDIKDPWGYNNEIYEKGAKELEKCIDKIILKL